MFKCEYTRIILKWYTIYEKSNIVLNNKKSLYCLQILAMICINGISVPLIYIVSVFCNSPKMITQDDKSYGLIYELNYWRSFSICFGQCPTAFYQESFSHSYEHKPIQKNSHILTHSHTYKGTWINAFNQVYFTS